MSVANSFGMTKVSRFSSQSKCLIFRFILIFHSLSKVRFLCNLYPTTYRLCMEIRSKNDTDYRKHSKKNSKVDEHYKPSPKLNKYLEEKLHLYTEERKLKTQGKNLSQDEERQKSRNERSRVNILRTHVFQAMADLIVFFEFVTLHHPELQEEFETELEELLMGWNKNDKRFQYTNRAPAFARFVWSATHWDYDKDRSNFRLSLLFQMQKRITLRISDFAKEDFDKGAGEFGISENIVKPDMERAFAWAGLYARNTLKSETQKEWEDARRPVLF